MSYRVSLAFSFPVFLFGFFCCCCELFPPSSRPTVLVCNSIKLSAIAQISCPAFPFARLYYNSPYSASLAFNHFSSAAGRIDRTKIQQQQHYRRSSSPNMQMYIANARQESELFFFLGIYLFIFCFCEVVSKFETFGYFGQQHYVTGDRAIIRVG